MGRRFGARIVRFGSHFFSLFYGVAFCARRRSHSLFLRVLFFSLSTHTFFATSYLFSLSPLSPDFAMLRHPSGYCFAVSLFSPQPPDSPPPSHPHPHPQPLWVSLIGRSEGPMTSSTECDGRSGKGRGGYRISSAHWPPLTTFHREVTSCYPSR